MMQKNLNIQQSNVQDSKLFLKKGDDYFRKKNYEESMKFYDLVIKINPQCSQAYINRGKVYDIQKKYNEAFEMFEKAYELNSLDDQVYLNRGITYFNLNDYQNAIEQYDYAIKMNSQDPQVYLRKGDSLIAIGNMEEALQVYNTSILYNPMGCEFQNKGDEYLKEKQYEVAIKFFQLQTQVDPLKGYLKQGDTLITQGKIEEGFCKFKEALKYNPQNYELLDRGDRQYNEKQYDIALQFYELLIEFQLQRDHRNKLNQLRECYFKKGDALLALGKIEETFCMFKEIYYIFKDLQYDQTRDYELIEKGDKYYKEQQYEISIQFYELLIKFNLTDGYNKRESFLREAYLKKGDALLGLGKIEEAFCMFREIRQFRRSYWGFISRVEDIIDEEFLYRGNKYFSQKQYDLAIQFYDLLIEFNSRDGENKYESCLAQAYLKKGDTLIAQEKINEAFCMFAEAVKYNPIKYEFLHRGDECFKEEKYDLAIQFYQQLATLYPLEGFLKKGDILLAQGKIEEAISMFTKALKYNPGQYEFLNRGQNVNFIQLGDIYFRDQQYDVAIQFFELHKILDPLEGCLKKGNSLMAQGKIEEAFCIFTEALKYNPRDNEFLNRGDRYLNQKQYDVAMQFYQLSEKLAPLQSCLKKGDTLIAQGKINEAFCMFREALKYNPEKDEFLNRGDKYYKEKQYDLAIQFLKFASQVNLLKKYMNQGELLILLGKTEDAFQLFREGLQENPDHLHKFIKRTNFEEYKEYALIFNSFLIYYQPDNIQHYLKQGDMLYKLGRTAEAIQILQKIPPEANLKYMLYLNRQFQEADDMICLDSNLKSDWAYHQVLILQEQGKYKIPKQEIQYVGSDLVVLK